MIRCEQFLPLTMAMLAAGSSIVYFSMGNWRQGLFWAAAAVINTVVTV